MQNQNNKILVIADDLTGCGDVAYWALDYGFNQTILAESVEKIYPPSYPKLDRNEGLAAFNACGQSTRGTVKGEHLFFDNEIILFNTNTRFKSPEIAYQSVKKIAIWAKDQNFDFIFKKMDSTLRGNWITENDALIEVFGLNKLPVVASYPEYSRITKNGYHYVLDKLVSETEFATLDESHIPTMIKNKSKFSAESHIPTMIKNKSKFSAESHIPTMIKNKSKFSANMRVYDYGEKLDINNKIYAGTSWFFGEILKHKFQIKPNVQSVHDKYDKIVIVAGSLNSVTRKQLAEVDKSVEILKSPDEFIQNYNINDLTAQLNVGKEKTLIICCGGDTSMAVCRRLKIKILKVKEKVATGIVLCQACENLDIILKPGGFGDKNFLRSIDKNV